MTLVVLAATPLVACMPAPVDPDAQGMDATVADGALPDAISGGDGAPVTCTSPPTPLEIGVRTQIETTPNFRECISIDAPPVQAGFSYTLPPGMYGLLLPEGIYGTSPSAGDCEMVLANTECAISTCTLISRFTFNCGIAVLGAIGHDNPTQAPQTVYIYVGSRGTTPRPFWLTVNLFPRPSTLCRRAPSLVVGAPPTLAEFANGARSNDSCSGSPSLFYQVTAPPRSAARIAITHSVGEVKARVLASCAAASCDHRYQTSPSELFAQNTTDSERTFIVEVSSSSTLSASVAHVENIPIAQSCSVPGPIALGESLTDDTRRATNTASCASADGSALFYSVSVPARTRAHFSVRRSGADNVRVRVLTGCDDATCAAATETVDTSATNFVIDNPSEMPVQRLIAVSATAAPTEFSLAYLRTNELPTNTSCASVMALFPGQSVLVDTSLGGGAPVGCETSEGGARYYSVVLSSRRRATVTLTQVGGAAMRLRTYSDCAMGVCDSSVTTTPTTPATREVRYEGAVMGGQLLSIGAVGGPASTGLAQLTVGPAMPL